MAELEERKVTKKQQKSLFQGLCCCCPTLYCCGYACCCCVSGEVEEKPLLESSTNGKYSLPKGQELQSMDMHFPSNQSVTESSPWSSERHSQASDIPNLDEVEPSETTPITQQPVQSAMDSRLSWKLQSEPREQASFTIQIRQQTEQ